MIGGSFIQTWLAMEEVIQEATPLASTIRWLRGLLREELGVCAVLAESGRLLPS